MAENISDAGLIKTLRNRFGIRGVADVDLQTSIVPDANLGDLDRPPYHSKGSGWHQFQVAAVAAQYGYCGLRADASLPPNFRAVIRAMQNLGSGTTIVFVRNNDLIDATIGAAVLNPLQGSWDSNPPDQPAPRPALKSFTDNDAVSIGAHGWLLLPAANGQVPHYLDIVLAPGNSLVFQSGNVNILNWVAAYWDEYYIG